MEEKGPISSDDVPWFVAIVPFIAMITYLIGVSFLHADPNSLGAIAIGMDIGPIYWLFLAWLDKPTAEKHQEKEEVNND